MSKTIMAVDDALTVRRLLTFTLKDTGYNVVEAESGEDALAKLDNIPINLLITDINMEGMDGLELVRTVRAIPAYQKTPILVLSADADANRRDEIKAAGATGWLAKPFKAPQLLAVVDRLLPMN